MVTTTKTSTSSSSKEYEYRDTTRQIRKSSFSRDPVKGTSRKALEPEVTASRIRHEAHDCDVLETDHIVNKVATRLFGSLFRFCLSHSFSCTTSRGRTYMNGARSKCGGCEAAHATLSPTLYDDILQTITASLHDKPFDQLEEKDQLYIKTRFHLEDSEIELLSSDNQSIRIRTLSTMISRLTSHERKGTFVGTDTERVRNATYENPRDSNRFDCHLERHLRPIEDQLADECRLSTKTPMEALLSLQGCYKDLVETAIPNLKMQLKWLDHFQMAWEELLISQSSLMHLDPDSAEFAKEFETYLELVDIYLRASDYLFSKQSGTPSFKGFKKYINEAQSPYTLKLIAKEKKAVTFQTYLTFLKQPADWKVQFHKAKRSIERRLHEAENQHRVLDQTPDDIKGMLKHLFGTTNTDGKLITPTKEDIAEGILDLVPPLTPLRTDLKRKEKSTSGK